MRRLIESGAVRGDRFLQIGLRGYWPEPDTLDWMAEQGMRSYEMTEIVHRGLDECLTEAFEIAIDDCDGVFLSVDIDVCDPGHAPGTGTPEPGGLSARAAAGRRTPDRLELPVVGMDVVEVPPPYDHADITAALANRVVLEALSGHRPAAPGRGRRHDLGPAPAAAVGPVVRRLTVRCRISPTYSFEDRRVRGRRTIRGMGELRAHTRAIDALHEDQVALRQEMRRSFAQVDQRFAQVERQFATMRAGLQQIVGLIERITPE